MMIFRFIGDESAATAIEYGLIIALISLAVASGVGTYSEQFRNMFGHFSSVIDEPSNH